MELSGIWPMVASGLAGAVITGVMAGWWCARRLRIAQALVDRLRASRELLDQQNTQARRQVEQLQLEMSELRLLAERERRRVSNSGFPADALSHSGASAVAAPDLLLREQGAARAGFAYTSQADADEGEDASPQGFLPTQFDRHAPG